MPGYKVVPYNDLAALEVSCFSVAFEIIRNQRGM